MLYKSFKIKKLLKTQFVILLTSNLSGIFANNYAEAFLKWRNTAKNETITTTTTTFPYFT